MKNEWSLIIPSFLHSQVDKKKTSSPGEIVRSNLNAVLDSIDSEYPDEDILIICAREKVNGEHRYGMAAIPANNPRYGGTELFSIELNGFKRLPGFVINAKRDVLNVIKRVLSNLIFS